VSRAFAKLSSLREVLVHTGQHFDDNMSKVFFEELGVPTPQHNLGIGGGSHGENTGRALEAIERILQDERPDWVLVYGDTDSTLAGALAAAKLCIPVAHVEAGLRSFNRRMPEELNRVLTDHLADALFVPSQTAIGNLRREGIGGESVHFSGDVMFDTVRLFTEVALERSTVMHRFGLEPGAYVLATIHRKENADDRDRLAGILEGLGASNASILLPVHPRTRGRIAEFGLDLRGNIRVVDPVGYLDMLVLERQAALIATDSGGVQKEAFFHGVPCIVFRDETEWTELVDIGATALVGADPEKIAMAMLDRNAVSGHDQVYGDGFAAEKIAKIMMGGHA
jgi:UDP-GlcNAc3NAcA epimerase